MSYLYIFIGTLLIMQQQQQYPSVSVVIPTLNEARNLYHVLPHIPSTVSEIVLVDGHSQDDTVAVAKRLVPGIRVLKQAGRGKGNALREGIAACTGDIIVTLDADGSTDPNEIPRFVEALLQGYDFAKGSRFMVGGGSEDITFVRNLGNYGLSMMVNMLFRTRFSDLCYGYNAFWKYCTDYVKIDCSGFEVETLLNLRMHKARFKIAEVPSFERRRVYGKSNLHTVRDGWRVLKTILNEKREDIKTSRRREDISIVRNAVERLLKFNR
jgi:glycosyltransferase involved in cell wall biosynthesis